MISTGDNKMKGWDISDGATQSDPIAEHTKEGRLEPCFWSPDGEWIAGGAADNANHKVYVWDIGNEGAFAAALDGGREPLIHVDVSKSKHPHRIRQGY